MSSKRVKKMKAKEAAARRNARKALAYLGSLDIGFTRKICDKIVESVVQDRRKTIRRHQGSDQDSSGPIGLTLNDFFEEIRCRACGNVLIPDKANPLYNWTPGSVKFGIKKCRDCKKETNRLDKIRRSKIHNPY